MSYKLAWLWLWLWLGGLGWARAEVIEGAYRDKPPYSYTRDGQPAGFLMVRTAAILQRAGIGSFAAEMPVRRITKEIQDNRQPICSPGWYKLPEREAFAWFSLPIHQDLPHLVVANVQVAPSLRALKSLRHLLDSPDFRLGKVAGVSYGPELDAMIRATHQTVMDSGVTPDGLARMIAQHRADYMLMDVEDYRYLLQSKRVEASRLVVIRYPDMPAGLKRYLMCSQRLSPASRQRIDAAIQSLLPNP